MSNAESLGKTGGELACGEQSRGASDLMPGPPQMAPGPHRERRGRPAAGGWRARRMLA